MEGNELNVFAQTHCLENEKEDNINDSISRHNKSGFRHFVEESTLRNVSLDELEELSDAGCLSNTDTNIRRTPSSISSEQPVRQAIILECSTNFLTSAELVLRVLFMICCVISLLLVTTSGTETTDVLDFPYASSIRAHIFVIVFAILTNLAFFIIGISSISESFPPVWSTIDSIIHASLCVLILISSTILIHVEYVHLNYVKPQTGDWSLVQVQIAGAFGIVGVIKCLFIALFRICARRQPRVSDEIVLTSLRSS